MDYELITTNLESCEELALHREAGDALERVYRNKYWMINDEF
jgi:hypothetical protein